MGRDLRLATSDVTVPCTDEMGTQKGEAKDSAVVLGFGSLQPRLPSLAS